MLSSYNQVTTQEVHPLGTLLGLVCGPGLATALAERIPAPVLGTPKYFPILLGQPSFQPLAVAPDMLPGTDSLSAVLLPVVSSAAQA